MRAARIHGPGDVRVDDLPAPLPKPTDVVVAIRAAGICGSDLHEFHGENPWNPATRGLPHDPFRIGHELAGVVVETGSAVDAAWRGRRVVVEPLHLLGCGRCRYCRSGRNNLCTSRGVHDGERRESAGFSELDAALIDNVWPLPDTVSYAAATLLDDYACAVHAVHRVPFSSEQTVVIVGTGPVALTLGQVVKASGAARTIIVGRRPAAGELAIRLGAADEAISLGSDPVACGEALRDATDGGADIVFETVGGPGETMDIAVRAVARGGVIGILGAFHDRVSVPYGVANSKEIDIRWSSSYSSWRGIREFQIALDLVASGRVRPEALVTHRFPLAQIAEAFRTADRKAESGAVKVVVEPQV